MPTRAPSLSRENQARIRTIVEEQRPALTRFALSLTSGHRQTAEDLVQEAMVRAWRHIDTVPTDRVESRRWLFTVTRRLFIDDFRRRQARPAEVYELEAAVAVTEEDTSSTVIAGQVLREAAARLGDLHREVLFEIFFQNRSVEEVAQRLGIPVGTVRSRMHYALRALRLAIVA